MAPPSVASGYIQDGHAHEGRRFDTRLFLRLRTRVTMAVQQRSKPLSIILALKILQFVKQLRRRVKTRVLDGSIAGKDLGVKFSPNVRSLSQINVRGGEESRRLAHRV